MRLEPVAAGHMPILAELAARTFSDTFGHLYPPEDLAAFLAKSYAVEALSAEVADQRQLWRIGWDDDGHAVAYLQCGPAGLPHHDADPQTQGEVKRIYVSADAQGRGIGKVLMTAALDHLTENYGKAPQWVGVWSGNLRAQAFYAAHGFVRAGEYQFPVGRTLDDEFILRRVP